MPTTPHRGADDAPPGTDGLALDALSVRYGATTVVRSVTLRVAPGEIVAVIGPSGCGKSTMLRGVAGLEPVHEGTVRWDGRDLAGVEPHRREFGLMFQDHALFPHRDVGDNVAFGLRMQHRPAAERDARVTEMLALVGLAGFGRRRVDELSGGEAQRVALARALAPRPRLVMLDEPLGSLDRSLRERLAVDIRRTVRELGVAALHVTHDQDEAFTVADRVAVMRAGAIERTGTPVEVWTDPRTSFVARFVGHHPIPRSAAAVLGLIERDATDGPGAVVLLPGALTPRLDGAIPAVVREVRFTTSALHLEVTVDGIDGPLSLAFAHGSAEADAAGRIGPGGAVRLAAQPARVALVDTDPVVG